MLLSVRERDFLASINLKVVYFQIPVHQSSRKLLRCLSEGTVLSVPGPVLRTADCPSGLHQGVCSCVCLGALPRDSSSSVPGRLAGPRLFGGGGQKECPVSALGLSLPRDSDKREVRSRTLTDCKLPRHDCQYRGRQDFSVPCTGREFFNFCRWRRHFVLCPPPPPSQSPRSALAGGFGSPGFAEEASSS